jgi:photosystem II stability/assembly factor-like uncharacterized protein
MAKRVVTLVMAGMLVCGGSSASSEYDPATADAELMPVAQVKKALFTDIITTGTGTVAIGERGHILYSSNQRDWTQIPTPTRSLLTNAFALGSNVWAVGHEQVILHSSDGGSTWKRQYIKVDAFGPLMDVMFLDDQRGMAIGIEGTLLKSSDGGETWVESVITDALTNAPQTTAPPEPSEADDESSLASDDMGVDETPPHLNAIARNSAGLLIVGESGAVFASTDSGDTWTRREFPYNGSMFGVITLDNNNMVAFGLNGHAFETSDLGLTWRKLNTGVDASLMGGVAVEGGRAVLVGARGAVLTKESGNPDLGRFTYQDGGALAGVIASGSEFIVVGENGLSNYLPKR